MKKLVFRAPEQLLDALAGALFDAGARGLQEGYGEIIAYVETEADEAALRAAADQLSGSLNEEEAIEVRTEPVDDSWQDDWQQALPAVPLTDRWVLRPTHHRPAPENEQTIWFQPQASFGDGSHATTQLAAQAVCAFIDAAARTSRDSFKMLDVGAGNGVLGLIALKEAETRGMRIERLLSIDVDEVAINSLKQNLQLNHFSSDVMEVRLGTLDDEQTPFDLIVANINTPVLIDLAELLTRNLAANGTLLLTGLLIEDEPTITSCFEGKRVQLIERKHQGEWSLLAYQRDDAFPPSRK